MESKNRLKINKKEVKTLIFQIIVILIGTFIMSIGFSVFLSPHSITPGGFMGIAQIIHDLLFDLVDVPISILYLVLNVFLYLYAVIKFGYLFGIRTGIGIFSYSIFVDIVASTNLVNKITSAFNADEASSYILFAIYGGVLMGIGIGFVFRGNGSTGGCDLLAVVINKFFPTITTGQLIIVVDSLVVILSAIVYQSLVLPLYALITIFLSGKIADIFIDGVRSMRAYYIITNKKEELSTAIFTTIKRGVTNINCEGMYTHESRDMLLVIVRRSQIIALKKLVKDVDPNSFMFCSSIKETYGKGFMDYNNKKQNKTINSNQAENETVSNENVKDNKTI